VGLGPDWRTLPGSGLSAALTGDVRRACVAGGNRKGREASDGWATAQYRAAVPLTGGASLSAGAGRARARARVGRPEKRRGRAARMHSKVLHLFELV
jgi:hypothetical protein